MTYPVQVDTQALGQAQCPVHETSDAGRGGWATAHWLKDVFELCPSLVSLAEKHNDGGSFAYDFIITVKTPNGFRHRLLERRDFHCSYIKYVVQDFVRSFPDLNSRWLDGLCAGGNIRVVVSRGQLGLGEADGSVAAQQKQNVLEENREWMKRTFDNFADITSIVKSSRTLSSPTTFALCLGNCTSPHHTWMKAPNFHKIQTRMKVPLNSRRSSEPHEIWVPGLVPEDKQGIEFTRADFAQKDEVTDEQKHKAIVDAMRSEPHVVSGTPADPKAGSCTECGASFATNERFGSGDERLCGECELKHDEARGGRLVKFEFIFKRRRPPVRKRNTRFDPRPGIDDVGLGGYGPNWED